MLELIYTSTKTLTGLTSGSQLVYVQPWDALFLLTSPSNLRKVWRDGSAVNLGVKPWGFNLGNLAPGLIYWGLQLSTLSFNLYGADQITGQYIDAAVLNPSWQPPNGDWFPGDLLDTAAGVLVHQAGLSDVGVYDLATGALLRRLTDPATLSFDNLVPGDPGQMLAISHYNGRVFCADYLGGETLWSNYLRPCLASAYDSRHRVLITLESDGKIRLYTLTAVGANLSDPVFIPADNPLQAYKVYEVSVQLTDSAGIPLPGQVVNWSLLGEPPRGNLRRMQSLTAVNGQATNYYFTPLNDQLGPETLQAQVVC